MKTKEIKLVELPKTLKIHSQDKQMTWHEAMDYAASIGMRLPTKFELQAIAESTDEFNDLGWCWSSSTQSTNTTNAWLVLLNLGYTTNCSKAYSISVLCVKDQEVEMQAKALIDALNEDGE